MNSTSKRLLRCALLTGLIAGLTGCIVIKLKVNCPQPVAGTEKTCAGGGKAPLPEPIPEDPWPAPDGCAEVFGPAGNSGFLNIYYNSFYNGNGGQACFPTGDGWDRYFPLPRYFLGPGVTPNAQSYTNVDALFNVTVRTCAPTNGTSLQTGIVIYEEFHPSTDKKCKTTSPACLASGNLTINSRPIEGGKRYRATVFYKSSTLGSLTNVQVLWSYP